MYKVTFLLLAVFFTDSVNGQEDYAAQREEMVKSQLLTRGINEPQTIRAMRVVERHKFVPPAVKKYAYEDGALPIGNEQTISQPYIVAYMTQELQLKPEDRVLEIGTGSGYQAAVLATIVDTVYTIEIVAPLGIEAQERLQSLGYKNVYTKIGDGYHGWPDKAPFDAIIVTAAVEVIPPALLDQLAEGGRMIIPVGQTKNHRNLILATKKNGKIKTKKRIPVVFVPFTRSQD
ncbi:MAG: protein-L-isoaspartate(D-aspartate) O-methyltransferase [Flavobacteriaceae bacterium]|nr:protein-L-isoaspartate(D-aspartate) O-methyltransferase [Flavobacteriaceae bacterium]